MGATIQDGGKRERSDVGFIFSSFTFILFYYLILVFISIFLIWT